MDKLHCRGCVDDFYNGHNPLGVKECWSLKTAKMVTRFRLDVWTKPLTPGAYTEVRVPDCYRQKGVVFEKQPHPEAVDVVRLRAGKGSHA